MKDHINLKKPRPTDSNIYRYLHSKYVPGNREVHTYALLDLVISCSLKTIFHEYSYIPKDFNHNPTFKFTTSLMV